jgi:parallel beta-helix repeat protein
MSFTTTSSAGGKTYYFSSSTGDDSRTSTQAQSPSTPWKTISKLNSFFSSLQPGDNVYFKSGDTFYGAINFSKSGSSSGALFFGAYGTGNKPIITGLADASGWKTIGTNLWESDAITDGQSTAMIVTVNGISYPMGRWPNATDTWGGFRTISSTNGTSRISDATLPSSPNWTSATIVMRKNQYVLEKGTVTSQSGTTLNYSSSWNQYSAASGYGYFIENSINTLDTQNEWYYNPSTKKLDIYSSSTPANVKISTVNVLFDLTSKSYLSFDNLDIRGSVGRLTVVTGSSNITFTNCDLSNAGSDAVYGGSGTSYFDFENCTINNSNHTAITLDGLASTSNAIIRNNNINNSAMNPGMLDNYWLTAAVYVTGNNNTIEKNSILNSGYCAIAFAKGNNFSIKNNFINNFESVLDEGGGIYTYRGSDVNTYSNNVVDGNIVINGIGATAGKPSTSGTAQGIYLDGNSQNVNVINNTVANVSVYGIFLMDAHEINVLNNTVYNCGSGAFAIIHNSTNNPVRNVKIRNNKLVMTGSTSIGNWSYQTGAGDLLQFGTSDSNVVATPTSDNNAFYTFDGTNYRHQTVAQWQSFCGQDMHSKASPKTVSSISSLRFEYNATSSDKTVSLGAAYIDITGTSFPTSITLAPYTSAILILASASTTQSVATAEAIDENNLIEKPAFTIYPNPTRDNFVLQLNNSHMGKMRVEIVNQAGSIIRSYLFNKVQVADQVTIPANDLSAGVYFIQVQIGTWSDRRKIIKL